MQRICGSLTAHGYEVILVGRKLKNSGPLISRPYQQKRIRCWYNKGKAFYAEYNIRLFFYLLFKKMDAVCAIDLDSILPCLYISRLKKVERIYDAHELFTGLKEVVSRPAVLKWWTRIEKKAVPKFKWGYTVSESIASVFKERYGIKYTTIRNMPLLEPLTTAQSTEKFILYQGAVNEARGFENLIPAMQWVNAKMVICGDGNYMGQLKNLISHYGLNQKIELKGMLSPEVLRQFSPSAYIAVAVPENTGMNQWLALPNKFFDYIHAGLPQVTVNYPEYRQLNQLYEVALLLEDLSPQMVAGTLNNLLADTVLYGKLRENCLRAREVLNWQEEEKKLLSFYQTVFPT
ncbi:MAG: glycosyltransferase [Chitinophagaceae bacterium]|nr:glycosyltransferase [Chitinophagaceae bacterium]